MYLRFDFRNAETTNHEKMKNYAKEFNDWFEAEKKNGLQDIKFFTGDLKDSTADSFYEEALAFLTTPITKTYPQGF